MNIYPFIRKKSGHVLLAALTALSCRAPKNQDALHGVLVTAAIPVVQGDSATSFPGSRYEIYCSGGILAYRFSYGFDSVVNGGSKLHESRQFVFVLREGEPTGYLYDPPPGIPFKQGKVSVDSILRTNGIETFQLTDPNEFAEDSSYQTKNGELVRTYHSLPSDSSRELIRFRIRYSKPVCGISESFFQSFDTVPGMKLMAVHIHAGGAYYPELKMPMPPRDYDYKMEEIPVKNPRDILRYIERFRKDSQR